MFTMHKAAPSNCLTLVSCMEILSLTCLLRTADSGEQSSHLDLPHYASLLHTCHVIARRIDGMSPTSRGRWSWRRRLDWTNSVDWSGRARAVCLRGWSSYHHRTTRSAALAIDSSILGTPS